MRIAKNMVAPSGAQRKHATRQ